MVVPTGIRFDAIHSNAVAHGPRSPAVERARTALYRAKSRLDVEAGPDLAERSRNETVHSPDGRKVGEYAEGSRMSEAKDNAPITPNTPIDQVLHAAPLPQQRIGALGALGDTSNVLKFSFQNSFAGNESMRRCMD